MKKDTPHTSPELPELPELLDDAALPETRTELLLQIETVESHLMFCQHYIQHCMLKENSGQALAKEIHGAKQRKMMLQYQKDLRTAKLRRLEIEQTDI